MSYHKYGKYPMYIGLLIALVFTATCRLQPFSSVEVKASPTVYMPLGSGKITVSDIDEKLENIITPNKGSSAATNARLFRYTPSDVTGEDKNQLRYLIHYPIKSFDFDINNYFGENAVGNDTGLSYNVDESISVPNLQTNQPCTIAETDTINTKLLESFNNDPATLPSVTIPSSTSSGSTVPVDISINFEGFKELTFEPPAYLTISANLPTGMACSFSEAKLTSNGNTFTGYSPDDSPNAVKFYIDNRPISNSLRLTCKMRVDGSNVSAGGTVTFRRTLNGTIKEAKGVNAHLQNLTLGSPQNVQLPLPEDFKKAVIGEGTLQFALRQPEGWSGITIKEKTKIEQAGTQGLLINPTSFRPLGDSIPLAGLKLNDSKTLTYTPELDVTLVNATYRKPSEALSADFSFSIQKFTRLTLKNKDSFNTTKREPVPVSIKKWAKTIDFNKVSATVKVYNGLPAGNSIKMKLSSTELHIPQQVPLNVPVFAAQEEKTHTYDGTQNWTLNVENTNDLDLTAAVELPDYNESEGTFTLQDIYTDTDIKVTVKTTFDLDWKKITLKDQNSEKFSYPEKDFINLDALSKLKKANLKLQDTAVYVYTGPASGLLGNRSLSVGLSALYKEGDNSTSPSMQLRKEAPCNLTDFPADKFASDKKEYTGGIPKASFAIKKGEPHVENTLTDVFNKYPTDMQLAYTLTMGGMEINRTDYDNIKKEGGKTEITLDVLLDVPFGFEMDTDKPIALTPFMEEIGERDIFNRKNANDKPLDNRITKVLRSIRLTANIRNESGVLPTITFQAKDDKGNVILTKDSLRPNGEMNLDFRMDEWDRLQGIYPVYPEILLEFPNDKRTIKINKDFTVTAALSVSAKTDIDYTINVN